MVNKVVYKLCAGRNVFAQVSVRFVFWGTRLVSRDRMLWNDMDLQKGDETVR